MERVLSGIVTIGAGWGFSGIGICILIEGMVVEDVEIIEEGVKEMDIGIYVMGRGEEVVGTEDLSGCETKE